MQEPIREAAQAASFNPYNINDHCRVKLTPFGVYTLMKRNRVAYEYNLDKATGILTSQIWCIMNTFGDLLFNGASDQPFEENIIEFKRSA